MKISNKIILVVIIFLLSLNFVGCNAEIAGVEKFYTVTYKGNGNTGGVVPIDSNVYASNQGVIVLGNVGDLLKKNTAFVAWNSREDGSGIRYTADQVFVMGSANITLYAQWLELYTVTYNCNGSTGGVVPENNNSYTNGQEVTVVGNIGSLVRLQDSISFNFLGWTNSSGVIYTNDGAFNMGFTNVTLYARWSALRATGPAGGLVFYDKGSYSDGWRYLEAAPLATEWTDKEWGSYMTNTYVTNTVIGSGKVNTTEIVAWFDGNVDDTYGDVTNKSVRAAYLCDALVEGGYSDWFLPSKDELNKMYVNLHKGTDENGFIYTPVGGFALWRYWSSSECDIHYVWVQSFAADDQRYWDKNTSLRMYVRAARVF